MCFTVVSLTRAKIKYAKYRGDKEEVAELEKKLDQLLFHTNRHYNISAFAHPYLLVFTNTSPYEPQLFQWGLIPAWVRDHAAAMHLRDQTLNARAETIFEKPSFRTAAASRHCLVYLDAFYEYHHEGKKVYPFHIASVKDDPLVIAGLWDEWLDKETGEVYSTVSLITCEANPVMRFIHNKAKSGGARMPVILPPHLQDAWLQVTGKKDTMNFLKPYPQECLQYKTVQKLSGIHAPGDRPEAEDEYTYEEFRFDRSAHSD